MFPDRYKQAGTQVKVEPTGLQTRPPPWTGGAEPVSPREGNDGNCLVGEAAARTPGRAPGACWRCCGVGHHKRNPSASSGTQRGSLQVHAPSGLFVGSPIIKEDRTVSYFSFRGEGASSDFQGNKWARTTAEEFNYLKKCLSSWLLANERRFTRIKRTRRENSSKESNLQNRRSPRNGTGVFCLVPCCFTVDTSFLHEFRARGASQTGRVGPEGPGLAAAVPSGSGGRVPGCSRCVPWGVPQPASPRGRHTFRPRGPQ